MKTKNKMTLYHLKRIETLEKQIETLEKENKNQKKFIENFEDTQKEWSECLNDLRVQRDKYKELVTELDEMKKALNKEGFKGRWRLIKFLMK